MELVPGWNTVLAGVSCNKVCSINVLKNLQQYYLETLKNSKDADAVLCQGAVLCPTGHRGLTGQGPKFSRAVSIQFTYSVFT